MSADHGPRVNNLTNLQSEAKPMMRERMLDKIARLERENAELRDTVAAQESGTAYAGVREQRDLLWLFVRQCQAWAHGCSCADRAEDVLRKAGLGGPDAVEQLERVDPKLALRLAL